MIDFSRPTALFGGSFDPIHAGHLHIARSVLAKRPEIRQFVFVPAAQSPGKSSIATPAQRLRWVQLVAGVEGQLVWDEELRRPGPSYTVDTLRAAHALGARKEKLYWVMGADSYCQFADWREPGEIRRLCRLIVVNRPGSRLEAQHAEDILLEIPPHPASSTALRASLAAGEDPEHLPAPLRPDLKPLFLRYANPYARKSE